MESSDINIKGMYMVSNRFLFLMGGNQSHNFYIKAHAQSYSVLLNCSVSHTSQLIDHGIIIIICRIIRGIPSNL